MVTTAHGSWLMAAAALHAVLRVTYVLGIGLSLRREAARRPKPPDYHRRWLRFKGWAATVLNADAVTFVVVAVLGYRTLPLHISWAVALSAAVPLAVIGISSKAAAWRVVGVEGYYWYDFFCPPEEVHRARTGIYRWFANPMYGPGYLHAFALALALRSGWGLAAALFDWVAIWAFLLVFERPHTRRVVYRVDEAG
jgi:protein-S-isoprenylcysteine O-methyltransferase Ste14